MLLNSIKASYGSDKYFQDVSLIVSRLAGDKGYMYVGAEFGDPAPGQNKSLKVTYECLGKTYQDVVPERRLFIAQPLRVQGVPSDSSDLFRIDEATYGADNKADVTQFIRDRFKDPVNYYTITNHRGAWPVADPQDRIHKFLIVDFIHNGRRFVSAIMDPDTHMRLLNPIFTVVIPTWNRSQFLKRCVQSAIQQDFDPDRVEIFVGDDGSTDETPEVMAEICRSCPRVTYLKLQHTGCPGLIRNKAIAVSSGTYIAYLDTDDKWRPNHLSALFKQFEDGDPYLVRAYHEFAVLRIKDGEINETTEQDFSVTLWNKWPLYPSCMAHPRKLLDVIGTAFPTRRSGDDTYFWWAVDTAARAHGQKLRESKETTVLYGLIVDGNNLTYELNPESQVYRDRDKNEK